MFPCFPVLRFPVPRFQSPPFVQLISANCVKAIPVSVAFRKPTASLDQSGVAQIKCIDRRARMRFAQSQKRTESDRSNRLYRGIETYHYSFTFNYRGATETGGMNPKDWVGVPQCI